MLVRSEGAPWGVPPPQTPRFIFEGPPNIDQNLNLDWVVLVEERGSSVGGFRPPDAPGHIPGGLPPSRGLPPSQW